MSAYSKLHPLTCLVGYLCILIPAMFIKNPVIQLTSLLGSVLFLSVICDRKTIGSDLGFYIPLFVLMAVTNPLFSHNGATPLFFMNGNPVTLEAVIYGIFMSVMITSVLLWCKCYGIIINSDKIVYLFGKSLPKLSLLLSAALKFIPELKRRFRLTSSAQKTLGQYSTESYTDRIKRMCGVFSSVIGWSLENAVEKNNSMKARGYGMPGRSNYSIFKMTAADKTISVLYIACLSLTLAGVFTGKLYFSYYPTVSGIPNSPLALASYFSYFVCAMIPIIVESEEAIRWKYYRSKI